MAGDEGSRKVDPAASSGSDSDSADSKSIPDLGHPHHGGGGREGNNPHSACNYIMGTGVLWPWGMTNFHFSLCVGVIGFFIFWLVLLLRIYLPDEYWVTEEEMAAEAAAEAEAEAEAEAAAAADPFAEGEAGMETENSILFYISFHLTTFFYSLTALQSPSRSGRGLSPLSSVHS